MVLSFYDKPLTATTREIRLLELQPGEGKDTISCKLKILSLNNEQALDYEALSYVWGEVKGHSTITVCGEKFKATRNLKAALLQLRHKRHSRMLWVDAVCINQGSLEERNEQVRLMSTIYSCARQVVVWLGEEDKHTKETVRLITRMSSDHKIHWVNEGTGLEGRDGATTLNLRNVSIFMFFRVEWWRRMWTLQEIVKAKKAIFVCGTYIIPGDVLPGLIESFHIHHVQCCHEREAGFTIMPDISNRIAEMEDIEKLKKQAGGSPFLELASVYRIRLATVPHDMIYGLLGMSSDLDDRIIDYNLPVADAFEAVSLQVMTKYKNLDIFGHILDDAIEGGGFHPEGRNIASWVPNWKNEYVFFTLRYARVRNNSFSYFSAAGSEPMVLKHIAPGEISLDGIEIDTIDKVGIKRINKNVMLQDGFAEWRELLNVDKAPEEPYVGGSTILDAYWRSICYNQTVKGDNTKAAFEDRMLHDQWWWSCIVAESMTSKNDFKRKVKIRGEEGFRGLSTAIHARTAGRRMFTTKKGYIGIASSEIEVGDQIFVLFGGKVPYVLRRPTGPAQENGEGLLKYAFVSDSYVHGIMEGEALAQMEKGILKRESFILC